MIDGFLNGLRRTGERVQRRSEEVAQAARLRLEIFQLGRELDAMYARLGRAYHGNASVSSLEEIRAEIARVDEEIAARERLMAELGSAAEHEPTLPGDLALPKTTLTKVVPAPTEPLPGAQTALSVWREKEAQRMTDDHSPHTDRPYGTLDTDPNEAGNPEKPGVTDRAVGVGNDEEREKIYRHPNNVKEGELSSRDPDPLASKD